jgi:hypothetical protein
MIAVLLASAALVVLAVLIVIEVMRLRAAGARRSRVRHHHPRRQPLLEDRLRDAFEEPRALYGDIFVSYMIWRREQETRLELFAGDPWLKLNDFTRALVVRHLWRALEALAKGSVVLVDAPQQQWNSTIDAAFDDGGVDPWARRPTTFGTPATDGPQFIKDR